MQRLFGAWRGWESPVGYPKVPDSMRILLHCSALPAKGESDFPFPERNRGSAWFHSLTRVTQRSHQDRTPALCVSEAKALC